MNEKLIKEYIFELITKIDFFFLQKRNHLLQYPKMFFFYIFDVENSPNSRGFMRQTQLFLDAY